MANAPKIDIMGYVGSRIHFCRGGTLFSVQNGLGRLSFRRRGKGYRQECGDCQVWMDDELLAAPYIEPCPSYAGHLVRGYGNGIMENKDFRVACEAANAAFEGMPRTLERISPLLGLLSSGVYLAADFDLFPTCSYDLCGTGRVAPFFLDERDPWERVEEIQSIGWHESGDKYEYDAPMFLEPSQRAASLNPERIEYYRKRLREEGDHFPRCIAVYLNGAYALLLDGHHKATAAAAEGERVRTIVLFSVDMKKREADSLRSSVRLFLRHNKQFREPKGEDLRPQKMGGKHGEPSGYGLFLCDGQENIYGRTFRLQDIPPTPLKPVNEGARQPWGKIPEEYLQRLKEYPTSWELMTGTYISPDKIKSAYEEFVELCVRKQSKESVSVYRDFLEMSFEKQGKKSEEYYSIFQKKEKIREYLLTYLKLFPESKWLSETQIERLKDIRQ